MQKSLNTFMMFVLLLSSAAAELNYTRIEDSRQPEVGTRRRQSPEIMIYAEAQLKYSMYQNYLHYWLDRPLFFDRATRHEDNRVRRWMKAALPYEIKAVKMSGLDGLGSFISPNSKYIFFKTLDGWLREESIPFLQLPQLSFGVTREAIDRKLLFESFDLIVRSPAVPRINGKALIGSYRAGHYTADEHRGIRQEIIDKLGRDDFILLGSPSDSTMRKLHDSFADNGKLEAEEYAELRNAIQEKFDIYGGVQINMYPGKLYRRPHEGDYTSIPCPDFFVKYVSPLLLEMCAEPRNQSVIIGLVFKQGYINHLSGMNHGEYGTHTLREGFFHALSLNPDLITLFEWNEFNENTCFQPTVYNGLATQRLLNYYSRLSKNLPPAPMLESDDTAIPNMIMTGNAVLKIGEAVRFELLNVPDTTGGRTYSAQLSLRDQDGSVIHVFPEETFAENKLKAVTYVIPSEQFQGKLVLLPELVVNGRTYSGLHYIRLNPSVSWNYKMVRHSLRDLLPVVEERFDVRRLADGSYAIDAHFECAESLASLEIIDNENEICASDPDNEFDPDNNYILKAAFSTVTRYRKRPRGTVTVKNVSDWKFRPVFQAATDDWRWFRRGDTVTVNSVYFWSQEAAFYFTVPKTEIAHALLAFEFDNGIGCHEFPVAQLIRDGRYSKALVGGSDDPLRVELSRLDNLPDVPRRLKTSKASISRVVRSANNFPVFSMRAIAESGRIYRSAPVVPKKPSGAMREYTVFSDTAGHPLTVKAHADSLPDINYIFSPDAGAAILNDYAPFFDAQLGGGFYYLEAFARSNVQPPEGNRVPEWIREGKLWALRFDGNANYINFGRETFPHGAFTLEMELMPEATQSMVIFRHFSALLGSISVFLSEDNILRAGWGDREVKTFDFDTGLKVLAGKWSLLRISYDFSELVFEVNGERRAFPFDRRAYVFRSAIFGGHTKREFARGLSRNATFFKGRLRKLRISHFVDRKEI